MNNHKKRIEIKLNVRYFLLQVLLWGAAVVNYGYMTQILSDKGFSEVEIGVLNSAKLLVGVFFQIWLGSFADRHAVTVPLKYLIAILALGSAVLTVALYLASHNFLIMLLISIGFGMTFTTISPLMDSLSVLYVTHGMNVNYAVGRTGGSVSWAVFCVVAGIYCDRVGVRTFPLLQLILVVLLLLVVASMPWNGIKTSQKMLQSQKGKNMQPVHTVSYLLKHYKKYVLFLVASAFMFMGYNLGTTFLIDVITGLGGGNVHYGIAEFVMAASEIPAAFMVLKCRKRISIDKMMLCCAIFMTLKTALPTYCHSLPVVIAAQACEMLGFGLFYSGSIYMISDLLPAQDIVKGATLTSVATVGLGEGIGSFFCGMIRRQYGLYGLMKASVYVSFVAVVIMYWMCMSEEKTKKVEKMS